MCKLQTTPPPPPPHIRKKENEMAIYIVRSESPAKPALLT